MSALLEALTGQADLAVDAGALSRATLAGDAHDALRHLGLAELTAQPQSLCDARAALRRLKGDLRAFRPILDREWVEDRRGDLAGPYEVLTDACHADVVLAGIADLRDGSPKRARRELAALQAGLEAERTERTDAVRGVVSDLRIGWIRALALSPGHLPVQGHPLSEAHLDAALVLPALVRRPWRRLREAARDDVAENRPLRLWARRTTAMATVAVPVLGAPAAELAAASAALQSSLERLGDLELLVDHLTWLAEHGAARPELAVAAAEATAKRRRALRRESAALLEDVLGADAATATPDGMRPKVAGGGVVWRPAGPSAEVVVVHRPRKDDWSLPKGGAALGEDAAEAALREVGEETGLHCALGPEVGSVSYRDRRGREKIVHLWAMTAVAGQPAPPPPDAEGRVEVDAVRWVPLAEARELVSRRRDREVLASFARSGACDVARPAPSFVGSSSPAGRPPGPPVGDLAVPCPA